MDISMIILLVVAVLLLIAYPILISSKNKKEAQKVQEQTNSLKKGDKILTTGGIYGTIVEVKFTDASKIIVIETGEGDKKSTVSVDAYAIYTVFKDDKTTDKVVDNTSDKGADKITDKTTDSIVEDTQKKSEKKEKKSKKANSVVEDLKNEEKKD